MLQIKITFIAILISEVLINSCGVSRKNEQLNNSVDYSGPPTLVYKTRKDYYKNVPVSLSVDKSKIVSYPAISDVYYQGKLSYPTKLENGYLLDNRGINTNTAFLSLTYEEYSKLKKVPKLSEMYSLIIDKNPLLVLYNLGNRYRFNNEIKKLNEIIKSNKLKYFKRLK
jgi:hypothetical protein